MEKKINFLLVGRKDKGVASLSRILGKEYPRAEAAFPRDDYVLETIMDNVFNAAVVSMKFSCKQEGSPMQKFAWSNVIETLYKIRAETLVFALVDAPGDGRHAYSKGAGYFIVNPIDRGKAQNIWDFVLKKIEGI